MTRIACSRLKELPVRVIAVTAAVLACTAPLHGQHDVPTYNRDVRPILSVKCFACHGFDAAARQADLRLDTFAAATQPRDGRAAIAPSNPDASEVWQRISSNDPDQVMPPPDSRKKLTSTEKEILRRWITSGARYERHWSFVPPRKPQPPDVDDPSWCRNAIDRFIVAKLDEAGLVPSPEANRETLIRRVTLDLTGLPSRPDDIDTFLHDTDDGAYERLVERLMSTTAYAERRAQDWLDLARYADTRGFADDQTRNIWPWRDWVIQAIDRNMPFDQFTIEQLAGDMLPNATMEQRLASAFHRNAPQAKGMTYPTEEYRVRGVIDRVNTTGRVWLGLTLGCAECHDHKFDPISQVDYYSMFAFFNNVEHSGTALQQGGPTMTWVSPEYAAERSRIEAELAEVRKDPLPLRLPDVDESLIGKWDRPTTAGDSDEFSLTGDLTIAAKIRTRQPVADIVSKYDWRAGQRSYVFGIGGEGDRNGIPGHLFGWISSKREPFSGVEVHGSFKVNDGKEHQVVFVFEAGKAVRLFVDGVEDRDARVIGNVPNSIAKSERRLAIGRGYNGKAAPDAFRFEGELSDVRLYGSVMATTDPRIATLKSALRKLESKTESRLVKAVPVMRERNKSRDTFIHVRGNLHDRGEQVFPAVPTLFGLSNTTQPDDRLRFARWLVNARNPLVARVAVNRFWQSHFGLGLVRTADDFGSQGEAPSHSELLDWLATEFVDSGWDMKHMHRLIVTSATYRQSTRISGEHRHFDPQNTLLSRMPRVRLPAEQIRDQALAVGGLLVAQVGGPPVFPTQPTDYWKERALPGEWMASSGNDRYRRTIYTYWRRMALHPALELLDAPARELCVARRDISNVPTQALVLLNDPMFDEAARAFAGRVMREADGDESRLRHAFRLVLGRLPDKAENQQFLAFVTRERKELNGDAAWTLVCSVLLNLDETVTRP